MSGGVSAGLALLAGLAPSPVLDGRLDRVPALAARCAAAPPALDHPDWAALLDAVTVQETRLFRHPAQFAALDAALAARPPGPLRLLSAGCATGEEAWSLAALAHAHGPSEVLGLDLCRPALATARSGQLGLVLGDPLECVPPAARRLFADGAVVPALRPLARFARATLLAPPPGAFDVIFCRNVLIYLHDAAREAVMRNLVAALRPGGLLGLGPTDRAPAALRPLGCSLWRRDG
ncbi:CheR family methyltransferase [Roseococcus sp. DSY-14]|uniref:CheR family methyltransferase n=1 Tax=Roseococcus sp. DSY-14 TaxID=3369650 RepID=UPI00387AAD68